VKTPKFIVFQGTLFSRSKILPFKNTNYVPLDHSKVFQFQLFKWTQLQGIKALSTSIQRLLKFH